MKRGIRSHLFQVLLLGILPVGLFAAALLFLNWRAQEHERRAIQMETTRVLATAVDNALDSTVQRAAILARLWAARPKDAQPIYEHAIGALAASPDWDTVLAFDAAGEMLFRTDLPFGAKPRNTTLHTYAREAMQRNQPMVSNVFVSSVRKQPTVGVAVPVSRDGTATHVLIVGLKLDWFDELIRAQGLPPGAIVGVFDDNLKFVARSHDGGARRGTDPAPGLHEDMRAQREGLGRYPSLDGTSVYTSWTRTKHGWTAGFATPAGPIDGALLRHLGIFAALLAATIVAGLAFALLKGRKIASSLEVLEDRAAQLARGQALPPPPPADVIEIDRALQAHERASSLLEAAQRERDELLMVEQKARAAAENANRAKDEFLAMLGHELRNPLAAISNSVMVLRSPGRSAEHVDFAAGVIHRQTGQLKRLIDDLLDVGRVMTGKIRLQRQRLDLEPILHQVVATLQTAGTLTSHKVEVRAQPAWIEGDQARIEQIITNLLSNAATHTPAARTIRVTLSATEKEVVVQVADEGAGIAREHMARIFDLFYQADGAGHGRQGGLGIGLTLVKRLVELHGGRVSAQSEGRGRGAVFTVTLPAAAPGARPEAPAALAADARTVLVVEDNADTRESLRLALEMRGHRVLEAADAGEALRELQGGRPAFAIIDIGLPGMDGYGLARRIRSEYDGRIALVALTGYGAAQDVRRALDAGFEVHLTKPVDPAELDSLLSRAK
jgi:signal transduction histidine kinase